MASRKCAYYECTVFEKSLSVSILYPSQGWIDPQERVVDHFVAYAEKLFESLPKVKNWITFNEPYVFCFLGYGNGAHAPGLKRKNYLQCGHSVIKSHARVYQLFNEKYRTDGAKLGITLNSNYPYSYYPEDPTQQNFVIAERAFVTEWFTAPIFGDGDYTKAFKVLYFIYIYYIMSRSSLEIRLFPIFSRIAEIQLPVLWPLSGLNLFHFLKIIEKINFRK